MILSRSIAAAALARASSRRCFFVVVDFFAETFEAMVEKVRRVVGVSVVGDLSRRCFVGERVYVSLFFLEVEMVAASV